jgi:hypothetical protein
MRNELEAFGHLIADQASSCLAYSSDALPEMFTRLRAEFADDRARLAVVESVEEMAASLTGSAVAERMGYRVKIKRARRSRKPTLAAALKQALKDGTVSSAKIVGDEIELRFGKQKVANKQDDEVENWIRGHAH